MIEELLPPGVVGVDGSPRVLARKDPLLPEEWAAVRDAAPERLQEFVAGRACAHQALAALGFARRPLLPGPDGAPRWPPDVVGSLTHCPGYAAAAVARQGDVSAMGIDAEVHAPLPRGVLQRIAQGIETGAVARLSDSDGSLRWDRLLFSAKEALYKAWFQWTGERLDLDRIWVELERKGRFSGLLTHESAGCPPVAVLPGRWRVSAGVVLTAVVVDRRAVSADPAPARVRC